MQSDRTRIPKFDSAHIVTVAFTGDGIPPKNRNFVLSIKSGNFSLRKALPLYLAKILCNFIFLSNTGFRRAFRVKTFSCRRHIFMPYIYDVHVVIDCPSIAVFMFSIVSL